MSTRKPYPSDVTDEEWAFVAPYLTLMTPDAPQRKHDLRDVFNALRWIVRTGAPWRYLPTNFPPWEAVYQQTQRWLAAGVFAAMVQTCGSSCAGCMAALTPPLPRFSTARRGNRPQRAGGVLATTGTNGGTEASSTWPATPSAICSPYTRPPPMPRTATRWSA